MTNSKACFGGGIRSSGLKLRDPRVAAALHGCSDAMTTGYDDFVKVPGPPGAECVNATPISSLADDTADGRICAQDDQYVTIGIDQRTRQCTRPPHSNWCGRHNREDRTNSCERLRYGTSQHDRSIQLKFSQTDE
jgi:hypothetical protein